MHLQKAYITSTTDMQPQWNFTPGWIGIHDPHHYLSVNHRFAVRQVMVENNFLVTECFIFKRLLHLVTNLFFIVILS